MKTRHDSCLRKIASFSALMGVASVLLPAGRGESLADPAGASGPADYELSWHTINGGGAMRSTGDDYELSGTIGQPDASGPMISGEYELTGGFWFAQVPGDCVFDGAVNLLDHATLIDCSAGPNTSPAGDGCACFDLDDDNDVDLDDYGRFQRRFNGP